MIERHIMLAPDLTAFGRPQDRDTALHGGFSDFLKTPVEPRLWAETVSRFVGS